MYDRETEEEIAFFNAKKIDCVLYRKTPNGHYFKVIYPGNYEEVDRKKIIRSNFFIKRGSFHRSVLLELEY